MTNKKVIEQLKSMKNKKIELLEFFNFDDAWTDEIIALDIAQRCVNKDKRAKSEFWRGCAFGFLAFVLFYILHNL